MVLEISFPTHKFQGALRYLICIVTLNGFVVTQETTALIAFVGAFLEKLRSGEPILIVSNSISWTVGLSGIRRIKEKASCTVIALCSDP